LAHETLSTGIMRLLRTVTSAMDAGDPFTHGRPYRCSKYAARLGRHFEMSEWQIVQLECAALLQDLGKKVILSGLLQKSGRLDEAEKKQIQTHTHACHDILHDVSFLRVSAELILAQHERPDGKGYPNGTAAERIPLGSRILSVVSAFDAMTCDRPYRKGLEPEEAYAEMRSCSGTMFFDDVVEALIQLHESEALFEEFDRDELSVYLGDDATSCRALGSWLEKLGFPGPKEAPASIDADVAAPGTATPGSSSNDSDPIVMDRDPFRDHAA